jgi:bile acid:Na+ symporter, BASS family
VTANTATIIRLLTIATLCSLLFASGLRLTWAEVGHSLQKNRLAWILPVNFVLTPALTFAFSHLFQLPTDAAVGMALLAAAPFAPVVPTFVRMARGDLAFASALTGLFPFLSAFITPLICEYSLKPWLETCLLRFNIASIFFVLFSTITLPLAVGIAVSHRAPALAARLLRPVEVVAEAIGSIALLFVTVVEFRTILSIGWKPLSAMVLTSELCFLIGYGLSGPARAQRLVVGLGTANRNIALALLIAVESFPGSAIIAAVVANGLLLIFLGLFHVFLWRLLLPVKNDG